MSADERWAVFYGPSRPAASIVVKDLVTGQSRDLGVVPGGPFGPVISPDGLRVAYQAEDDELRTIAVAGGAPQLLCRGCLEAGYWTRDSRYVGVVTKVGGRTALGLADARTGEVAALAEVADGRSLNRPSFSPDNRWIAFRAVDDRSETVYVARFDGRLPIPADAWVALGPSEPDLRPVGWSPSGRMLYLFSSRDGFRCLYVQRMDPATGRPLGAATLVRHVHNVRASGGGGASVISTGAGNAVGRRQILFDFPNQAVNVWQMRLGVLTPPRASPPATP